MSVRENRSRLATPEESRELWSQLFDGTIQPNAQRIAEIVSSGGIAVVVHELHPSLRATVRSMGWRGKPVFPMPRAAALRFAMATASDEITRRWLRREGGAGRVLVLMHLGSFLFNLDANGFALEPGSTDAERGRAQLAGRRVRRGRRS